MSDTDLDEKGLEAATFAFCVALEPHEYRADRMPKGGWMLECGEAVDLTAAISAAIRAYKAAEGPVARIRKVTAEHRWYEKDGELEHDVTFVSLSAPQPSQSRDEVMARPETASEHIARDMAEGRFPERSEPQMCASVAEGEWPVGDAYVTWYEPTSLPKPGKLIDASLSVMNRVQIGDRFYSEKQVHEIVRGNYIGVTDDMAAYAALWRCKSVDPTLHEARRILLEKIGGKGSDCQRAAVEWIYRALPKPTERARF